MIIEVEKLRKEYRRLRGGRTVALHALDLVVPEGGVFGFLGPNGAGKTTTIRCLLGLVRASGGRVRILGANPWTDLARVIHRIGCIVETPALFPGFSGRLNLDLLGRTAGVGPQRVNAVLDRVGLSNRADDLVKTYSLGMKQRLGLAAALLKDPELLLLDEPAVGLDPAGIVEVRELLRGLGTEGRTVFISSHILSEVQQMCDRVAIIARGRLLAAGPVSDVLARKAATHVLVRVDDLRKGLAVLRAAGFEARLNADRIRVEVPPSARAAEVTRALARKGLYVSDLRRAAVDLEQVFLDLTAGEEEAL